LPTAARAGLFLGVSWHLPSMPVSCCRFARRQRSDCTDIRRGIDGTDSKPAVDRALKSHQGPGPIEGVLRPSTALSHANPWRLNGNSTERPPPPPPPRRVRVRVGDILKSIYVVQTQRKADRGWWPATADLISACTLRRI